MTDSIFLITNLEHRGTSLILLQAISQMPPQLRDTSHPRGISEAIVVLILVGGIALSARMLFVHRMETDIFYRARLGAGAPRPLVSSSSSTGCKRRCSCQTV